MKKPSVSLILALSLLILLVGGSYLWRQLRPRGDDPASKKVATEYLQAALDHDTREIIRLSPHHFDPFADDNIKTIFDEAPIGNAKIIEGHALNADEFKKATMDLTKPFKPSDTFSDFSKARSNLKKTIPADDVVFYKFEVRETTGRKRRLSAYITMLKTKDGAWVAQPGITGGLVEAW